MTRDSFTGPIGEISCLGEGRLEETSKEMARIRNNGLNFGGKIGEARGSRYLAALQRWCNLLLLRLIVIVSEGG